MSRPRVRVWDKDWNTLSDSALHENAVNRCASFDDVMYDHHRCTLETIHTEPHACVCGHSWEKE
jgi:hypothetical protein